MQSEGSRSLPRSEDALGEHLVAQGYLSARDLERVGMVATRTAQRMVALLLRSGLVGEQDLAVAQCACYDGTLMAPGEVPDTPVLEDLLPVKFLRSSSVLPLAADEQTVTVALLDPQDDFLRRAIELATDRNVAVRIATSSQIDQALSRLYGGLAAGGEPLVDGDASAGNVEDVHEDERRLRDLAAETPVVRYVNTALRRASEMRASDVHLEPYPGGLKLRFRIDGVLHDAEASAPQNAAAIVSRIKIMARLNIAERRLPQDGRIRFLVDGKQVDCRVSTVPTLHGESVVLRLLDKGELCVDLEALGFGHDLEQSLIDLLGIPHGMILVTGPTGSGKTTTLYALLQRLNTPERKILTVEDPVEYQITGINQIPARPQIGLTFANVLRSIVRQDPDVIMIGEMRDLETAGIGVQAALTGHLVLSSLHTNDAGSSVTRLLDMGVEDYLITSTVTAVVAQRLARRLCTDCRRPMDERPEWLEVAMERGLVDVNEARPHSAAGCGKCNATGYRGRIAVAELLIMSEDIRKRVLARPDGSGLQEACLAAGMRSIRDDGLLKAAAGITSYEEIVRVTRDT